MKRWSRKGTVGLLVGSWLALTGIVRAGPYVDVMQPHDCPPTHYSALHVLTPSLYRWAAWCQGPRCYTFAKIMHPDVPTTNRVVKYHCPSINPIKFSLANYPGLEGAPPSSTYQSQAQAPTENRAPELLPPVPEMGKPAEKLPPPHEAPQKN